MSGERWGWGGGFAGRWGDNRSPAFGELSDYHLCELHTVDVEERRRLWGGELATEADLREVFAQYVEGARARLPWCVRLEEETAGVQAELARLGRNGLLTINSQPRVNGAPSTDPVHGWGGPGGFVYQKAYVEFFCSPAHLQAVRAAVALRPRVQYTAVNRRGELEASSESKVSRRARCKPRRCRAPRARSLSISQARWARRCVSVPAGG